MSARTGCVVGERRSRYSSPQQNRHTPRVSYTNHLSFVGRILRCPTNGPDRSASVSAQTGNGRPQDPSLFQQPNPADTQAFQQYDLPSSRSNGTAEPAGQPTYTDSRVQERSPSQPSSMSCQASPSSYALQRVQQPPLLLSFCDALKDKDIITTAEGTNLGKAEGAIIDSTTMTLEAVTVAENASSSAGASGFCIPTATLSQVGDVILVSEERALRRPPAVAEFVSVLGTHVRSARGTYIGKVKDVDFDPETGAISAIYYDEYGLAWLPLSMQLVNLYGVPTETVLEITREEVVIDDRSVWLAIPGKVEGLGKALKSLKLVGSEGDSPVVVAARQSQQLQQWEQTYGMTAGEWLERYGEPQGQPQTRRRLPDQSARAPRRGTAPPAYQQQMRGRDAAYDRQGMSPRQYERPRNAPPRQERERAPDMRAPRRPAANRTVQQPRGTRDPSQQGRQASNSRQGAAGPEGEPWAERPAYGSVLQPDPRSRQYEEAQRPLLEKRTDDAM